MSDGRRVTFAWSEWVAVITCKHHFHHPSHLLDHSEWLVWRDFHFSLIKSRSHDPTHEGPRVGIGGGEPEVKESVMGRPLISYLNWNQSPSHTPFLPHSLSFDLTFWLQSHSRRFQSWNRVRVSDIWAEGEFEREWEWGSLAPVMATIRFQIRI